MSAKTLDLRGCSAEKRDSSVTRAIAIIAGYSAIHNPTAKEDLFPWYLTNPAGVTTGGWRTEDSAWSHGIPSYATSADAVLSLLEKAGNIVIVRDSSVWSVDINEERGSVETDDYDVVTIGTDEAPTLAQAACVALLRANGWEILT